MITDIASQRLSSQLLTDRVTVTSPEEVVGRLLAVQAQDPRGMRLAIRSRAPHLDPARLDDAFGTTRSLVVTWLNRGTLHLVTAEDYWWLHAITAPRQETWNRRRLTEEGVSRSQVDQAIGLLTEAVARGPQTRQQLRHHLDDAGIPTGGQALHHLVAAAHLAGELVRGPMIDGSHAHVAVRSWLGDRPPIPDRGDLLAVLARRYLAGHGPASDRDLARWAGITLGDARLGLSAIAADTRPFADLTILHDHDPDPCPPPPRLLGSFDPLLLGWTSREPFVSAGDTVITSNGIIRPVALVDQRVLATWGLANGVITLRPFAPIAPAVLEALAEEADAIIDHLGLPHTQLAVD